MEQVLLRKRWELYIQITMECGLAPLASQPVVIRWVLVIQPLAERGTHTPCVHFGTHWSIEWWVAVFRIGSHEWWVWESSRDQYISLTVPTCFFLCCHCRCLLEQIVPSSFICTGQYGSLYVHITLVHKLSIVNKDQGTPKTANLPGCHCHCMLEQIVPSSFISTCPYGSTCSYYISTQIIHSKLGLGYTKNS
jgi:hypothetical protein